MIVVYAKCIVNDDNVNEFTNLASELITKTREEAGNISYELIRGIEDKSLFAFIEKWKDKASLDIHMNTPHFISIVPQLGILIEGEMKITIHEVVKTL